MLLHNVFRYSPKWRSIAWAGNHDNAANAYELRE